MFSALKPIEILPLLKVVALWTGWLFSWGLSTAAQPPLQEPPGSRITVTGRTMGPIVYRVVIHRPSAELSEDVVGQAVQEALDKVNRLMSTYLADSDVTRFNQSRTTDWFEVDFDTAAVVARSLEISQLTAGAFDITVAPAVNRWKFGPEKQQNDFQVPSEEEIRSLKALVGYQNLAASLDPPRIRKSIPELTIDLSGIAKGYATDQVAAALDRLNCQSFMVEVGGEVFVRGNRADGTPWRIGIEKPSDSVVGQPQAVALLTNQAIATSGDYRNFFEIDGQRYSHTIDPATCQPVNNDLALASIIADDCMTADAFATAVLVLGEAAGFELCGKLGLPLFVAAHSSVDDPFLFNHSTDFPILELNDTKTGQQGQGKRQQVAKAGFAAQIWPIFLATLIIFSIAILAMAIGTIFGQRPISGSCGGLANRQNAAGETVCGVCSKPSIDCKENQP